MKRMTIATLVMSLIASSAATAGSIKAAQESAVKRLAAEARDNRHDRRDDHRDDRADRRDERRDDRWDRHDERRDDRWDRRDERRDDRWDRRDERRDDRWDRRDDRRDWRRVNAGPYRFPHGYRAHYWRRGDRLPATYYSRPYVIRDYRACNLRAPPRGHHYVRVNQDVVLAAIATGLVLEVFRDYFY
jgi:Ni/Co efflux regulator RcnB